VVDKQVIALLDKINKKLKSGNVGLTICVRGRRLNLRGVLPPKDGNGKWSQQFISPHPPILANIPGCYEAERIARIISGKIADRSFSWSDYTRQGNNNDRSGKTLAEVIPEYEQYFFAIATSERYRRQNTWKNSHYYWFARYGLDRQFDHEEIIKFISSFDIASPSRRKARSAFKLLADWLGMPFTDEQLSRVKSSYSRSKLRPKNIPEDSEIEEFYHTLAARSEIWATAYALIAVFGLRPSECWYIDWGSISVNEGTAIVTEGKTGRRIVYARPIEWWHQWQPWKGKLPQINQERNSTYQFGVGVYKALNDYYKMPFLPYSLRHAYAIRLIHDGIPDRVAAAAMGHTVEEHIKTYQRWIRDSDIKRYFLS
jgi:integrase